MLTAAGATEDKVYGLTGLGADDCLAKPFGFAELSARIRALSRCVPKPPPLVLRHAGITLDRAWHEVRADGRLLELTPKEFAVLRALMEARRQAVPHAELVRTIWVRTSGPGPAPYEPPSAGCAASWRPGPLAADTGQGHRLCG